jgi:hypothetical protein
MHGLRVVLVVVHVGAVKIYVMAVEARRSHKRKKRVKTG